MKIGIVTVYRSENCGSYLQAWAMQTVLREMGHEPQFLPYEVPLNNRREVGFQVFKCCVKGRFSTARFLLERRRLFRLSQKKLQICRDVKQLDVCIFGSDTIWNFEDAFFRAQRDFFFGFGMNCPKIAYAVSVGSTSGEQFWAVEGVKHAVESFSAVGVRDAHLQNILSDGAVCKNMTRVIDPTMLLKPEMYAENPALKLPGRFVFVYYFGRMSDGVYSQLKDFCEKRGLEIMHMGLPDKRFSSNVTNAPENFVRCFREADFVLTNTFHGCVFSILFNKRFATDGYAKKKVDDLIRGFHLETQYLQPTRTVEDCFETEIPYDRVNERLEGLRMESLAFLKDSLESVC